MYECVNVCNECVVTLCSEPSKVARSVECVSFAGSWEWTLSLSTPHPLSEKLSLKYVFVVNTQ
jgi:hypothetical protein